MSYLITISEEKDWITPNRNMDWFVKKITENIDDKKLIKFIEVSTYINGIDFQSDHGDDNYLRDKYLELLKSEVPKIIKKENHPLVDHLRNLEQLLKEEA